MCANGGIKPPMKQRYCCEDIERVLFCDRPVDFGSMACRVAECAEYAFDEAHKALMLVMLVRCSQRVKGQSRATDFPDTQGLIHQLSTISLQAGFLTELFREAFRSFKNRMEIIIDQKFCAAEMENIRMNLPLDKSLAESAGGGFRFC